MSKLLNRRDFIKMASLTPLLALVNPSNAHSAPATQPPTRPNVLVIVFDTLAAKHTSLLGYGRHTTPSLERFAEHATLFHKHYAGGNFTSAGASSLLTGSYTWTQRSFNFFGTVAQDYVHRTLFRMFRDAGYFTFAYTHNWLASRLLNQFQDDISYWKPTRELCLVDFQISDHYLPVDQGVAQEAERDSVIGSKLGTGSLFLSMLDRMNMNSRVTALSKTYQNQFPTGLPQNSDTIYFRDEDAIDWLINYLAQAQSPYFGYIHLLPPHEPYRPRIEFLGRFDKDTAEEPSKPLHALANNVDEKAERVTRKNYDEFLAYADAEFGRLHQYFLKAGTLDNTIVVFTSDHGQMMERGMRGHITPLLYESIVHVPLIISVPGQPKPKHVHVPTSNLDLLPTLARLTGQPIPTWAEGQLLPEVAGNENPQRSVFTIEAKMSPKQGALNIATVSMVKEDYKLIHYRGYKSGSYGNYFEMYDLAHDPEELTDIFPTKSETANELKGDLLAALDQANAKYSRG